MKQTLKTYKITLKTVGPVYIGSGKEISKKEYVFMGKDTVGVLDIAKVYDLFKRMGKAEAFEAYLLGNSRDDMNTWLKKENIAIEIIKPFIKYTLDNSNTIIENKKQLQIMEMMKDPYGNPYIPGSSLKGMIRTILLSQDILQCEKKYAPEKEKIVSETFSKNKSNRNRFLKANISYIEGEGFRILQRDGTKPYDAVNDYLQGLVVSDSEPLHIEDLVLCQRVELHTDGREARLPVLRECIKPGTEIQFALTIDTSICPVDEKKMMDAVKSSIITSFRCFSKAFPGLDKLRTNQVYLGGGCGFVYKTVVYPMFGKENGLKVTKAIFKKTGVPRQHMHDKDEKYGVSPHILKCTKYKGKLLQMGLCDLKMKEE